MHDIQFDGTHTMDVIRACPVQCCHCHSPSRAATLPSPSSGRFYGTNAAVLCSMACNPRPARLLSSLRGRERSLSVSGCPSSHLQAERGSLMVCAGLGDFWGGDLLGLDLDKWYKDVEDYGSIAIYPPHEGGYEGRYATRLKQAGYHFMNITARGLGDPEAYLTKVHGVRPAHLGKQAIECFYLPPELDYRLAALPKDSKGIVLWVIEAKVLSKTELQYLALLPALRNKVKVIADCGTWRKFRWKPLRVAAGLPLVETSASADEPKVIEAAEAPKVIEDAEAPKVVETAEASEETKIKPQVEKEPPVKVPV